MFTVKQKIKIARGFNRVLLGSRRLIGRGPQTQCRRRGITWSLDLNEGIDLSIYLLGAYEPQMLRAYAPLVRPGDTVFDIGANIGAHTLHFARLVGDAGRVYAFEPTDFAFGKLRKNLLLNPACDAVVSAEQAFLVAERTASPPSSVYSSWPVGHETEGLHEEHLGKSMSLSAARPLTGDDYGESQRLARLDLIKIDVDGHEFTVLQGLRSTLARFRPKILIELAPFVFDEISPDAFGELIRFLASLDYNFFNAYTGRQIPADESQLRTLLPSISAMNVLLRPRA